MLRQKGEEEQGFRLLTAKYGHSLYRHIRRTVIAHDDAEDVLQETMIQIFCHLETFKGEAAQLKAWIFRIATNEALMHLRRQTRFYESIDDVNPQLLARLQSEDTRSADDVERLLQEALLTSPRTVTDLLVLTVQAVMNTRITASASTRSGEHTYSITADLK